MPRTRQRRQNPCAFLLVREREVQPGGQNDIVFLERGRGGWRVCNVNIAERILPSQPLAQLGDAAEGEGHAILSGVAEVREEVQLLSKERRCAQVVAELLPESKSCKIALEN